MSLSELLQSDLGDFAMMAFVLYFFLLLAGYILFCTILYWKWVQFYFIRLPSMGWIPYLAVLGGTFVLVFGLSWFIGLSAARQSVVLRVLFILVLLVAPSILYLLFRRRRVEVRQRAGEIQSRIARFRMALKRDPQNWSAHLGLAKVYDEQNLLKEAIEAYSAALSLMGESPLRFKTESQVEFLKRLLEKRRAEKTLVCVQCGTKNLSKSRVCCKCQASLYRTIVHWIYLNLDRRVKYGLLGIVLLFSVFFFWVNPFFVVLLIFLWSFNIIYFFIPIEFKS